MFCGLGGFRVALESLGGKCVFSSDIDKTARRVYKDNFGEEPSGDIKQIEASAIPDHDILCGGFPCQAFSTAGNQKGFADPRGTLFAEIVRIAEEKKPSYLFLENVPGLLKHDEGRTLTTIISELERIGYTISYQVVKASPFVPQMRKRLYIIGCRNGKKFQFPEPPTPDKLPCIGDILEENPDPGFILKQDTWDVLQTHKTPNGKAKYHIVLTPADQSRTLVCNELHKQLIDRPGQLPRKLTTRERLRCHGYPDSYKLDASRSAGHKLTGNTVSPPVIRWIAEALLELHPN